ncbi:DUF1905 domain-containing protein [Archangium sp.]|uniref:DUF1905 domain-containing protein n=1 Tax=Archangium sp. TaxID=1872627 RepID=UPI003899EAD9
MRQEKFATAVEAGHKGLVYIRIPFDPSVTWDVRTRHFVRGRLNGCSFEGEIGFRRRKFYMLLDEELQRAAKLSPGDTVEAAMEPREPGEEESSSKPGLAWGRLASGAAPRPRAKSATRAVTAAKKPVRAATKKKATRKEAQSAPAPARKKPPARKRVVKKT